jgi:hypothetical protein
MIRGWFDWRIQQSLRSQFVEAPASVGLRTALKAEVKRQTIEKTKRASGQSFASVATRKRPSLKRASTRTSPPAYRSLPQDGDKCEGPVKIGFVSLPGNSRRTDATYFFIISYIVEILASF